MGRRRTRRKVRKEGIEGRRGGGEEGRRGRGRRERMKQRRRILFFYHIFKSIQTFL